MTGSLNKISLIDGFHSPESEKVDYFLRKLIPHLVAEKYLVVGGLAIRYLLFMRGIDYPTRDFNDLDIKLFSGDVLSPSISKDFLIYHYHPTKNNSFFFALIDPKTKIKVDLFDSTIKYERFTKVPFHRRALGVVGVEDQLVKTVFDIQRISNEQKVDPKQFIYTSLLRDIADLKLADKIWKQRKYENYPPSLELAIERAEKVAKEHPGWVKENRSGDRNPMFVLRVRAQKILKLSRWKQFTRYWGM